MFLCDVDADRCWQSQVAKASASTQAGTPPGGRLLTSVYIEASLTMMRPPSHPCSLPMRGWPRRGLPSQGQAGKLVLGCSDAPPRGQAVLARPSYCAGAPRPLRSRRAVLLKTSCWGCARRAAGLGQPPSVGRICSVNLTCQQRSMTRGESSRTAQAPLRIPSRLTHGIPSWIPSDNRLTSIVSEHPTGCPSHFR